ncbi:protein-L-isoaspartate(D-aspartate) O-methyltransferase [Labrenzia sp. 011]|uniref:protein-L-isoaspartate(D-aspartate) O-methyltransferase n=1 Tax=Labrenzia sp. 011 TaxID=2171494 RepID=UPI000D523AA8|nr:protein-L-isoaspartate(D-aspartate) O-methyltransferase [Labrenzia sp. 011]PVB62837.1 protein-L-isoaspartate O-methyltransferase [Labrenzia sp. 011]
MKYQRKEMVLRQLEGRGIRDQRVLSAMRKVPRHIFVPAAQQAASYNDGPLPIGCGQTISQPYMVALMCELLDLSGNSKVLEIGTGCGYAAAVLAELSDEVITIERMPELVDIARENLLKAGYPTVRVICADGSLGYPREAPFDAIAVAAGAPSVPEVLKQQLKTGGRLVLPVGSNSRYQELLKITRLSESEFETVSHGEVAFVPLVGAGGWPDDSH